MKRHEINIAKLYKEIGGRPVYTHWARMILGPDEGTARYKYEQVQQLFPQPEYRLSLSVWSESGRYLEGGPTPMTEK